MPVFLPRFYDGRVANYLTIIFSYQILYDKTPFNMVNRLV